MGLFHSRCKTVFLLVRLRRLHTTALWPISTRPSSPYLTSFAYESAMTLCHKKALPTSHILTTYSSPIICRAFSPQEVHKLAKYDLSSCIYARCAQGLLYCFCLEMVSRRLADKGQMFLHNSTVFLFFFYLFHSVLCCRLVVDLVACELSPSLLCWSLGFCSWDLNFVLFWPYLI